MHIAAAVLAGTVLLLSGAGSRADSSNSGGTVLRVADRKSIPFAQMVEELARARAVFVGELHDFPGHHRIQLDVIRALHESDVDLAVGLEMFRAEDQEGLDRWVAGRMEEREFRELYEKNWTLPWELYAEIFRYAREHRIRLLGLNIPDGITSKVARSGFSSLKQDELRQLPQGIACEVDDEYMEFIRRSHSTHGHEGGSFRFFCEAQMVWDGAMAKRLAEYLVRSPRRAVVVLAGSGHAWRRGIPARLKVFAPDVRSLVVMPYIAGRVASGTVTADDADYIVQ
jgi:uncharacterized iron-regulated protein